MDGGWALILSAVVTTVGGVLVALIAQFRKENKQDHAVVAGMLSHIYKSVGRVETKVDKVEHKLNDHIKEHTRS
jgi:DNA anti-recombination protein RmuC